MQLPGHVVRATQSKLVQPEVCHGQQHLLARVGCGLPNVGHLPSEALLCLPERVQESPRALQEEPGKDTRRACIISQTALQTDSAREHVCHCALNPTIENVERLPQLL